MIARIKPALVVLIIIWSFSFNAQSQPLQVDICVYGGTSAGVIAAYTARKMGKTVILIEPGKHLGGLSSGGLGWTDIGNKYAVTGIARDFYRRIGKHYGKFEHWIFEPHVAENIFNEYIQEGNVEVLFDHRIVKAVKSQGVIQQIIVENSLTPGEASYRIVKAKVFVDCSYEGDLMARSGVSYTVGRESNKDFKETYNGVQLMHKHQFPDSISPYIIPDDPSSGLLWGISAEPLEPAGTGDKKVQAYNFRVCLTKNPENRIEITKPDNYDSSRYELLIRLLQKEPNRPFNLILKPDPMPNDKTDINNNGPFSTDMIGMNYDYPDADYEARKTITKNHEDYIKGLFYFIGHDERIPEALRAQMLQLGYPKDEYTDNGNWSPQMYVREARRMRGAYLMTQHNCEGRQVVVDGVGLAAYKMDSHNTQRIVVNGMVKNEGDVQMGDFPPYPIAYRSLIPKKNECKNLLVPVCLSATHIAYGSIRMEPVFMVLGQSSALAASMAIDGNLAVHDIDVKALQAKLKSDPLANGSIPEILVDNEDVGNVSAIGNWVNKKNLKGSYGPSYLVATPDEMNVQRIVRFIPEIKSSGKYQIFVYVPKVEKTSSQTLYLIKASDKIHKQTISAKSVTVEGQTSGEWVTLGTYDFKKGKQGYVELTTEGSDGIVIADAMLFIPIKGNK
jgi:hypothetical protein